MTRHLADHRTDSNVGRMTQFLRIDRSQSDRLWHPLWQKSQASLTDNRRVAEFLRIDRQVEEQV
ncbi:MAG: hypothetical protein ABIV25_15070 [Paracoccaceae bacterium]